jgi:acyl-CoA dehydrogenase
LPRSAPPGWPEKLAAIAHQVHRTIGFTHGHDLPRLTRRLWSWGDEFANESRWSLELGKQVIAACAAALWQTIAGR